MHQRVTYGQLRDVLSALGFSEIRRAEGSALKHPASDTVFLFRAYANADPLSPAELFVVRQMLDEKGLLEPESLDVLLSKAPA